MGRSQRDFLGDCSSGTKRSSWVLIAVNAILILLLWGLPFLRDYAQAVMVRTYNLSMVYLVYACQGVILLLISFEAFFYSYCLRSVRRICQIITALIMAIIVFACRFRTDFLFLAFMLLLYLVNWGFNEIKYGKKYNNKEDCGSD